MPADSSLIPREPPGWYLVTDQGVVLSVRFDSPEPAEEYRRRFLIDLRHDLRRAQQSGAFIAERVRAVRVAYGVLVGAWCAFVPTPAPGFGGEACG